MSSLAAHEAFRRKEFEAVAPGHGKATHVPGSPHGTTNGCFSLGDRQALSREMTKGEPGVTPSDPAAANRSSYGRSFKVLRVPPYVQRPAKPDCLHGAALPLTRVTLRYPRWTVFGDTLVGVLG